MHTSVQGGGGILAFLVATLHLCLPESGPLLLLPKKKQCRRLRGGRTTRGVREIREIRKKKKTITVTPCWLPNFRTAQGLQ